MVNNSSIFLWVNNFPFVYDNKTVSGLFLWSILTIWLSSGFNKGSPLRANLITRNLLSNALEIQKSKYEWATVFRQKYLIVSIWKIENLHY